ncbi:hypothetical protein COCMIDRAFT_107117, partial [Bipolaris oryzae ATCC 44560]
FTNEHARYVYVSLVVDPLGQRLYPNYSPENVRLSVGIFCCPRSEDFEVKKAREAKQETTATRYAGGLARGCFE